MSGPLWPRLWHIRISYDLFQDVAVQVLSDAAYRALFELVAASAADQVWTYSEPRDGTLPDDDIALARLARAQPHDWQKIRPEVEPFFKVKRGRWTLRKPWVLIQDRGRTGLSGETKRIVLARAGQVCTYCGDTAGPFDYDHILPVVKGGLDDPSNLTLACASCNRSKGGKTLAEWRGPK